MSGALIGLGEIIGRWRRVRCSLRVLVAAAVIGSVGLILHPNSAAAAFPGANGRIAFVSDRDGAGHTDIYTVNPDGSDPLRLTSVQNATSPAVSPDGSKIVFVVGTGLWVMNADGSGPTQLSTQMSSCPIAPTCSVSGPTDPAWSPDGTKIVFGAIGSTAGGGTTGRKLWVMDATGGNARQLTSGLTFADTKPAWSPLGNLIAFQSNKNGKNQIFTIAANPQVTNPAGVDGRVQLTQTTGGPDPFVAAENDENPSWSPDGTRIAFDRGTRYYIPDSTSELWTIDVNADGTTGAGAQQLTDNGYYDGYPAWSPDGTRIAFVSARNGYLQIFSMAPTTNAAATLVMDTAYPESDTQPDWGPGPKSTTPPTISGSAQEGQTLTEAHGTWSNNPTSYTYQWQRCDSTGNNCTAIAGATAQSYTLATADVGSAIRVQEWATGTGGTGGPATSAPTAVVSAQSAVTPPSGGGGGSGGGGPGTTTVITPPQPTGPPPGCLTSLRFGVADVSYAPGSTGFCFYTGAKDQYFSVPGQPVLIDGVRLAPDAFTYFQFDEANFRIFTLGGPGAGRVPVGIGVMWDKYVIPIGNFVFGVDWNVKKPTKVATDLTGFWAGLGMPLRFEQIELGKAETGAVYGANIPAHLELPDALANLIPDGWATGASADVTVHADNTHGLSLVGVNAKWPKVPLGALELDNLSFAYNKIDNSWSGGATLKLPNGLKLGAALAVKNNALQSASASVKFPDPGQPVFTGVTLSQASLEIIVTPRLALNGSVQMAALGTLFGHKVAGIKGNIGMYFANASSAMDMKIAGNGRTIHLTTPGFYVSGEAVVVDKISLGNAYAFYVYPSILGVGGQVGFKIPNLLSINAKADITGDVVKGLFNAEASASLCDELISHQCATGKMVLSNKGIAGCIGAGFWSVGGAMTWDWKTTAFWNSCDVGKYRVTIARVSAAAGAATFTVSKSAPFTAVQLQSGSGAPDVTLTGPGGQRIIPTGALYVDRARGIVMFRDPDANSTFIALDRRFVGRWGVEPASNSPAITRVLVGDGLPQPKIAAHVTGSGRTRTLTYMTNAGPGQQVSFFETGSQTYHLIGTTTARRGKIRFTIADGPAGPRQVIAQVSNDTSPRAELTVARFVAPPMPRLTRPTHLTLARNGDTLTVKWRPVPGARGYALRVDLGNGRHLLLIAARNARSLRLANITPTTSAAVRVAALDQLNAFGPAAQARLRAQPQASLSQLSIAPSRFKASRTATIRYRLSRGASVNFLIERLSTGRRLGRACMPDTPQLHAQPTCTAWIPVGATVTRPGHSGFNTFRLGPRATGPTLTQGSYHLIARINDSGISQQRPVTAAFSITK